MLVVELHDWHNIKHRFKRTHMRVTASLTLGADIYIYINLKSILYITVLRVHSCSYGCSACVYCCRHSFPLDELQRRIICVHSEGMTHECILLT